MGFVRAKLWRVALGMLLSGACAPAPEEIGVVFEALSISNPIPQENSNFGISVAGFGKDILVGAPGTDVGAAESTGQAYLLDGETGEILMTIPNPDPDGSGGAFDNFGQVVAGNGKLIAVGNRSEDFLPDVEVGEVYLFDGKTGALLHTLVNPEPEELDEFGDAIAFLKQHRIAVGAPSDTVEVAAGVFQFRSGSVSVFDTKTGAHLYTLTHPDPVESETIFGVTLAALGKDLLVGAPNNIFTQGDVYLFEGKTGAELLHIPNPDPASISSFGTSVAALGKDVIVGAPNFFRGTRVGVVYLFDGGTGELLLTIPDPDLEANAGFGSEVAAVGKNILVSAPNRPLGTGKVYLFDGKTGALLFTVPSPSPDTSPTLGNFGLSIAAFGRNFVVGAPNDTVGGFLRAGSIYTFDGKTGALLP